MQVPQEPPVVLAAHQVARGVVRQGQGVRPGFDLRDAELHRGLLHTVEGEVGLPGVIQGHEQEGLHAEAVVTQRPRPHGLADDGHFVAVFLLEQADGVEDAFRVLVREEIGRDVDVVHVFPDRLAHLDRGPVVLLLPLDLAAQRGGFLNNGKDRHDAVETQLGVPGGREPGHQFRVPVGVRKGGVDQVHQLHRGDGRRIAYGRAVHGLPPEGGQHPIPALHFPGEVVTHDCLLIDRTFDDCVIA